MNQQSIDAVFDERDQLRTELEQVKAEKKAILDWLDNNTTFCNPGEVPVLSSVSLRIWYHASDDTDNFPFSEVINEQLQGSNKE